MSDTQGIFAAAIKSVLSKGEEVIVVHGGGPQINAELKSRNIESTFVNGYRFTTDEIFDVVDEVLSKIVGPEVANNLILAYTKVPPLPSRAAAKLPSSVPSIIRTECAPAAMASKVASTLGNIPSAKVGFNCASSWADIFSIIELLSGHLR